MVLHFLSAITHSHRVYSLHTEVADEDFAPVLEAWFAGHVMVFCEKKIFALPQRLACDASAYSGFTIGSGPTAAQLRVSSGNWLLFALTGGSTAVNQDVGGTSLHVSDCSEQQRSTGRGSADTYIDITQNPNNDMQISERIASTSSRTVTSFFWHGHRHDGGNAGSTLHDQRDRNRRIDRTG